MRRFATLLAVLLIGGCTISNDGITPFWMQLKPPEPAVIVQPKPFIGHEFRCLVIEDKSKRSELSKTQLAMLTAKNFRDFLKANCVKDAKGSPQFRFVDKDEELKGIWQQMKTKAGQLQKFPTLIMQNGDAFYAEPLPEKWDQLQAVTDEYAGVKP